MFLFFYVFVGKYGYMISLVNKYGRSYLGSKYVIVEVVRFSFLFFVVVEFDVLGWDVRVIRWRGFF